MYKQAPDPQVSMNFDRLCVHCEGIRRKFHLWRELRALDYIMTNDTRADPKSRDAYQILYFDQILDESIVSIRLFRLKYFWREKLYAFKI